MNTDKHGLWKKTRGGGETINATGEKKATHTTLLNRDRSAGPGSLVAACLRMPRTTRR